MKTGIRGNVGVVWFGALAGLAVFLLLAGLVSLGLTDEIDRTLLLFLREAGDISNPLGPPWFEETAADLTALGGYPILVLVFLFTLVGLWLRQKTGAVAYLVLALGGGSLLSTGLKLLFSRPRPDLVDHLDRTFTSSFPSAHAMVSMLAWLTIAAIVSRFVESRALRRGIMICAFLTALIIGITRVYLGVHWPSDVIAGWSVGLSWASVCWLGAHYLSRRPEQIGQMGRSNI